LSIDELVPSRYLPRVIELVDSLISKSDGSNKVIDIDVFGIDVTEGGNHDHPHLEYKHGKIHLHGIGA
jgi:hypothetical protein